MKPLAQTVKRLKELADELPLMAHEDDRDLVIDYMKEWGFELGPRRNPVDRRDRLGIIDAALRTDGALRALVEVIEFIEKPPTREARGFRAFVDRALPSDFFGTIAERRRYLELVGQADLGDLTRLYHSVTGRRPDRPYRQMEDLVWDLETQPVRREHHPLSILARVAARSAPAGAADELEQTWAPATGFGDADDLGRPPLHEEGRPGAEPVSIMIRLDTAGNRHDRYRLRAWIYRDETDVELIYVDEDVPPRDIAEIEQALITVFDLAIPLVNAMGAVEPFVEFFMPREILDHAVDEWHVPPGEQLGYLFPVLVRDAERQYNPHTYIHWKRKWEWIVANGHDSTACPTLWLDCGSDNAEVMGSGELFETKQVSLGITAYSRNGRLHAGLERALNVGVPVGLFRRVECAQHLSPSACDAVEMCEGARFKNELIELLEDGRLAELPKLVLDIRRRPGSDLPGRHLTLLWDDPTRRPEAGFQLEAPTRSGGPS